MSQKTRLDLPAYKFWQNNGQLIAVAHRGGDILGAEKENSLAAIEASIKLGYTWFETDIVPTSDGKLLAIHGRGYQMHPNRDLPTRRAIQGMTFSQVQKNLRIGGEPVPLLEEILTAFPSTKWFIDPKVAAAVEPLIKILKQPKLDLNRISVGAFSQKRTSAVVAGVKDATGNDVCTSIGPIGAFALLAASDVVISQLEPRDRFLLRAFTLSGRTANPSQIIQAVGATSVHVPYRWINNGTNFVDVAHAHGLYVASWTPNQVEDMNPSIEQGCDAIMSDNVRDLKKALLAHGATLN